MDPNLWANGENFEDLTTWCPSPSAMDYHSYNLGFVTNHKSSAACFTMPQLPINIVGGGSSQDMVQFDKEVPSSGEMGFTCSSQHLSSTGSLMDIVNSSQGISHQFVVGPSSSSSEVPQRTESGILYPIVESRTYTPFSPQDVEKLIQGVEQYGRSWKYIKFYYFNNNSARTKDQLKEKWRHMLKSAHTQTDSTLKGLYLRAKNVDATLPKYSRRRSYGNL